MRHHVSLQKSSLYRVTRTRSCKYLKDVYCDNDSINMTPTRCSVLITLESRDELISLRGQLFNEQNQHFLHPCENNCSTSKFGC